MLPTKHMGFFLKLIPASKAHKNTANSSELMILGGRGWNTSNVTVTLSFVLPLVRRRRPWDQFQALVTNRKWENYS